MSGSIIQAFLTRIRANFGTCQLALLMLLGCCAPLLAQSPTPGSPVDAGTAPEKAGLRAEKSYAPQHSPVEQLRREIEQLRAEVERLRGLVEADQK